MWFTLELQLRRPDKLRYRVDELLKRKAEEGVKIFVIVYKEVSNRTTPTDSKYDSCDPSQVLGADLG